MTKKENIKEEKIQEKSIQEESIQEESIQEESIQEESIQEESIQEEKKTGARKMQSPGDTKSIAIMRTKYAKKDGARYVSHLDLQRIFGRALRKAKIPVTYSQGFNPHPKLAFGSALGVGVTSSSEYIDIEVYREMDLEEYVLALNSVMPEGIEILGVRSLALIDNAPKIPALMSVIDIAEYEITFYNKEDPDYVWPGGEEEVKAELAKLSLELLGEAISQAEKEKNWTIIRDSKRRQREIDIKPWVYSVQLDEESVITDDSSNIGELDQIKEGTLGINRDRFVVKALVQSGSQANVRATEIVEILRLYGGLGPYSYMIHRSQMGMLENGKIVRP